MDMRLPDSRQLAAGDGTPPLQPFGWHDLCARLSAAQASRRGQNGGGGASPAPAGSFHALAARLLASTEHGSGFVNSTSSTNGKDNQGKHLVSREPQLTERAMRIADENRHD